MRVSSNNSSKPKTFVASTVYHLYLIICKLLQDNNYNLEEKQDNLLMIIEEATPKIKALIHNIEASVFFSRVVFIPHKRVQKSLIGKYHYKFNRSKMVKELDLLIPSLKKEEDFIKHSDIYICNTDPAMNYLYLKYKYKKFYMIEDGCSTYQNKPSLDEYIKRYFFDNAFITNGYGKEIKTIYALHPNQLSNTLQAKSEEIKTTEVSKNLNDQMKREIFQLFNLNYDHIEDNSKKALIITQPLTEDKWLFTEEDKVAIYRSVIAQIPNNYQVFIKTHPREKTDYALYFKNAIIIPSQFPIEIMNLDRKTHFHIGYTLFSTALNNLNFVDKKEFVGDQFVDKFKEKKHQKFILTTLKLFQATK